MFIKSLDLFSNNPKYFVFKRKKYRKSYLNTNAK